MRKKLSDTLTNVVDPMTRYKTLEGLNLTHKDVIMCQECRQEWPLTESGVKTAVKHGLKFGKRRNCI